MQLFQTVRRLAEKILVKPLYTNGLNIRKYAARKECA
jgi:hypothetical protein